LGEDDGKEGSVHVRSGGERGAADYHAGLANAVGSDKDVRNVKALARVEVMERVVATQHLEREDEQAAGVGAAAARGADVVGEEGAVRVPAEDEEECGRLRCCGRKEQPRELRRGRVLGRDGKPAEADGAERGAVGEAGEAREDAADEVGGPPRRPSGMGGKGAAS
jgi:hypothetical protein